MTLLAALLLGACEKDENQTATQGQTLNRVILLPDEEKTGAQSILLAMTIGHSSRDCKGCIMIDGHIFHVDCMGNGNYCATIAAVQLQQIGTAVTATTTDTFDLTSEDFFLMPDRSLEYVDEKENHIFLNVPEQMVYRDTTSLQFTFTGLFFSETAAYSNY
ncbi:MAG: hypothetical protein IKZ52_09490 [Bacteroidales bacterium]|nr:hypothetical protein [Bacteroidales bacterium]